MMRKLSALVILGLLTVGLALPASAHSFYGEGDCDGWTLHLDGTWNATDITVDGVSIGLEQNPTFPDDSDTTSRTFVVVWVKQAPVTRTVTVERVLDCETETTTTLPEETTTTVPEVTTTTVESTTSTTAGTTTTTAGETTTLPETTTIPGVASWDAGATCEEISVTFGEGIIQVDIHSLDTVPGTDLIVGDLTNPFTESGSMRAIVSGPTVFRLIPVPEVGYTVNPEFIDVTVPVCEETTTTAPVVTTAEELPFTGPAGMVGLLIAGLAAVGIGTVLVREFSSE